MGGDNFKLGEEVIAVLGGWGCYLQVDHCGLNQGVIAALGEWGCFLQGWDLVDPHHEKEWVITALGEWGCFLWAWVIIWDNWDIILGKGHLIWGNGDFIGWKCHVIWGIGGCVSQLRINFTGLNGHVIWGRGGCRHPAQDHVSSFFSLSALLLFSYPDYGSILFHPVKTILDYSIIFLGSPHITHANFVKKCLQFCPK